MTSYSLQSVADAPPNGHVLAKAISSTVDDDPAPPTADTSSAHRSLWVKSPVLDVGAPVPVYPNKETVLERHPTSH